MKRGALVLCGGRSTRMGRDKAGLPFGDETLLQRIVRLLLPTVEEVVVVAGPTQELAPLPPAVRIVRDEELGHGPLAGLVGGLLATRAAVVYATACDVPFLEPRVLDLLFDRLQDDSVAVIEKDGFLHPLAAVYRRSVGPVARRLFAEGQRRPIVLYDLVPTVRIDADEVRAVDPGLGTLDNLNTKADYESALARLAREEAP